MKSCSCIARVTVRQFGWMLIFLMFTALDLQAQGRLLGRISDKDGNAVVAAVVSLSGEKMTGAAISNSQGYYTFLSVPEGNYRIRAIKSGEQTRQYDVLLADKTTVMMNIRLGAAEKTEPSQPAKEPVAVAQVAEKKTRQKPVAVKEVKPKKPKEPLVAKAPEKPDTEPAKQAVAISEPQKEVIPSSPKEPVTEAQPELITSEIKDENLRNLVQQTEASEALARQAVEKRVSIEGGMEAIYKYLQYPPSARNTNKAVMVAAKAYVDQNGHVSRVDMLKKAQEVFNEEVYRVLTEDINFIPAEVDAKPVPSVMTIIVNFAP